MPAVVPRSVAAPSDRAIAWSDSVRSLISSPLPERPERDAHSLMGAPIITLAGTLGSLHLHRIASPTDVTLAAIRELPGRPFHMSRGSGGRPTPAKRRL